MRREQAIYGDESIVKYTINIPLSLYAKITRKSHNKMIHRSVWVRDILEKECQDEKPYSLTELKRIFRYDSVPEYCDPPRRFHGFLGGLGNSFKLVWFKNKRQRFLENQNS